MQRKLILVHQHPQCNKTTSAGWSHFLFSQPVIHNFPSSFSLWEYCIFFCQRLIRMSASRTDENPTDLSNTRSGWAFRTAFRLKFIFHIAVVLWSAWNLAVKYNCSYNKVHNTRKSNCIVSDELFVRIMAWDWNGIRLLLTQTYST